MGKRMTTTAQQTSPSKKPMENSQASRKHDREPAEKPTRGSRVEQVDWRGEGVVSNNHTD
jgi:hypothetical protein